MLFRKVQRNDLRIGRISDRLSNAEQQAQREQHRERAHKARRGCRRRPEEEASGDDPVDVHSVYQPAGYGLQTRVSPEERREQNSQLRCRDSQLVLQHRSSDREIATIYIVYEDGDSEQDENRRELARESLALWHRKRWHEDGVILSAFTDFCNSICWNGVWRARGDGPSSRFRVSSQRNRKQHQDCWRNIPIALINRVLSVVEDSHKQLRRRQRRTSSNAHD